VVQEEIIRCPECMFQLVREQLRKTSGWCPKCDNVELIPDFNSFGARKGGGVA